MGRTTSNRKFTVTVAAIKALVLRQSFNGSAFYGEDCLSSSLLVCCVSFMLLMDHCPLSPIGCFVVAQTDARVEKVAVPAT
jgi:hypothetical protein